MCKVTQQINVMALLDKLYHKKFAEPFRVDTHRYWLLRNLICTDDIDEFVEQYKKTEFNYLLVDEAVITPSSKLYKGKDFDIVKLVWVLKRARNKTPQKQTVLQFFPSDNGKRIEAQRESIGSPIYVLNNPIEFSKLSIISVLNQTKFLESMNVGPTDSISTDG